MAERVYCLYRGKDQESILTVSYTHLDVYKRQAMFSHDLPYYWAMLFYYGNGYWQKGIPAQPEDMDAYEALENKIMEKYDVKEPFIWT